MTCLGSITLEVADPGAAAAVNASRGCRARRSAESHRLALYRHRALAKDAGVAPDGSGSHRLIIENDAGPLSDPDGFTSEATDRAEPGGVAQLQYSQQA
jgi:hypothetical protein